MSDFSSISLQSSPSEKAAYVIRLRDISARLDRCSGDVEGSTTSSAHALPAINEHGVSGSSANACSENIATWERQIIEAAIHFAELAVLRLETVNPQPPESSINIRGGERDTFGDSLQSMHPPQLEDSTHQTPSAAESSRVTVGEERAEEDDAKVAGEPLPRRGPPVVSSGSTLSSRNPFHRDPLSPTYLEDTPQTSLTINQTFMECSFAGAQSPTYPPRNQLSSFHSVPSSSQHNLLSTTKGPRSDTQWRRPNLPPAARPRQSTRCPPPTDEQSQGEGSASPKQLARVQSGRRGRGVIDPRSLHAGDRSMATMEPSALSFHDLYVPTRQHRPSYCEIPVLPPMRNLATSSSAARCPTSRPTIELKMERSNSGDRSLSSTPVNRCWITPTANGKPNVAIPNRDLGDSSSLSLSVTPLRTPAASMFEGRRNFQTLHAAQMQSPDGSDIGRELWARQNTMLQTLQSEHAAAGSFVLPRNTGTMDDGDDGFEMINGYSIMGHLGSGATAKVLLAVDTDTDMAVAIKVFSTTAAFNTVPKPSMQRLLDADPSSSEPSTQCGDQSSSDADICAHNALDWTCTGGVELPSLSSKDEFSPLIKRESGGMSGWNAANDSGLSVGQLSFLTVTGGSQLLSGDGYLARPNLMPTPELRPHSHAAKSPPSTHMVFAQSAVGNVSFSQSSVAPLPPVEKEIRIMRSIRHANIVSLLEVIEDKDENEMFLVLSYIPHGPLLQIRVPTAADEAAWQQQQKSTHSHYQGEEPSLIAACLIPTNECDTSRDAMEEGSATAEDDGEGYLRLDLSKGLLGRLACEPIRPLSKLRILSRQLVEAIYYLHVFRHIVHRDIKPDNILLDATEHTSAVAPATAMTTCQRYPVYAKMPMPRVYLADFGSAERFRTGAPLLPPMSIPAGTPAFFAPEVCNGQESGPAADVWSLGVTLYASLFGVLPFSGNSTSEMVANITSGALSFPATADVVAEIMKANPDPSPDGYDDHRYAHIIVRQWKDLLASMLKKNPNDRLSIRRVLNHAVLREEHIGGSDDPLPPPPDASSHTAVELLAMLLQYEDDEEGEEGTEMSSSRLPSPMSSSPSKSPMLASSKSPMQVSTHRRTSLVDASQLLSTTMLDRFSLRSPLEGEGDDDVDMTFDATVRANNKKRTATRFALLSPAIARRLRHRRQSFGMLTSPVDPSPSASLMGAPPMRGGYSQKPSGGATPIASSLHQQRLSPRSFLRHQAMQLGLMPHETDATYTRRRTLSPQGTTVTKPVHSFQPLGATAVESSDDEERGMISTTQPSIRPRHGTVFEQR